MRMKIAQLCLGLLLAKNLFALAWPTIEGTVTNVDGTPAANAEVNCYEGSLRVSAGIRTESDGHYHCRFAQLPRAPSEFYVLAVKDNLYGTLPKEWGWAHPKGRFDPFKVNVQLKTEEAPGATLSG